MSCREHVRAVQSWMLCGGLKGGGHLSVLRICFSLSGLTLALYESIGPTPHSFFFLNVFWHKTKCKPGQPSDKIDQLIILYICFPTELSPVCGFATRELITNARCVVLCFGQVSAFGGFYCKKKKKYLKIF